MYSVHVGVVLVALLLQAGKVRAQAGCDAPQILIVLDQSSSMGERAPLDDGTLKWDASVAGLTGLTGDFETSVDFGLMLFPSAGQCTPGAVDVPIAPNNAEEIAAALPGPPPYSGNYTPMAESLYEASEYAPLLDSSRRSYVALITDGWQWCDPYDATTRFDPVDATEALTALGVTTFVIGFGDGVDSLTLNQASQAARTTLPGCDPTSDDPARADNCYHQVDDLDGLRSALDSIALEITEEICDGLDNNCDGRVDEDLSRACTSECGSGHQTCEAGVWLECDAPLPELEICDGIDNDCDSVIDPGCECTDGETRPCGSDIGECSEGLQSCEDGEWGECDGMVGAGDEICDGLDNDCDGTADDDAECADGEECVDGECRPEDNPLPDPCDGVECDDGQECLDGTCVDTGDRVPIPEDDGSGLNQVPGPANDGCDCQTTGSSPAGAASIFFALLAILGLRRSS